MNMNKNSRITNAALVVLGASLFTASVNAGMPPSRQTPFIVPSDKKGLVEVGPCELPPCVGGVTCTPNARDYGYYEATWRQWPTQQRYDQKFPEALDSHPMKNGKKSISTTETLPVPTPFPAEDSTMNSAVDSIAVPVPVPVTTPATVESTTATPQPKDEIFDADSINIQDEPEPAPVMGNFEGPSTVPSTTIVPQPTQTVDPLLDYSSNTVPGISTAPATSGAPEEKKESAAPQISVPETKTESNVDTNLDSGDASNQNSGIDTDLDAAPVTVQNSASEPDTELTPPAPETSSPLIESGEKEDDSLSVPVSRGTSQDEHSILVSQRKQMMNPYEQATDPYQTAIQVSHEEKPVQALNPFQTAVIASEVENAAPVAQNVQESFPATPVPETKVVGLEGFCPVTLLEKEDWVEGKPEWTVMNHGIIYHLASAEHVQKFMANPDAYTPVMDGADPVLFAETGEKQLGNADNCVVFKGKLYMFTSEENLNKFSANSKAYMK